MPLRSPGQFRNEVRIFGVKKPVVCYAMGEVRVDVLGEFEELGEDKKRVCCILVEITRRTEGVKLSCHGLVLRWSSPERKTYASGLGCFRIMERRRGALKRDRV